MYCSSCGKELSKEAVICPACGAPTRNYKQMQGTQGISSGAIVALYLVGAIIPVLGVVGAIFLLVKGKTGPGIGLILVSVLMAIFWFGTYLA